MNSLFPVEYNFPEGLSYFSDFLSEQEERNLLNSISDIPLHNMLFQGFEAKRRIASFGYDWSFEKRILSKGKEIPSSFHSLIEKLTEHLSVTAGDFAELLITEYPVGSVINWHRDAPPFDLIAGVSLLSDCIFKMRPHEKAKQKRNAVISFSVKRRSLYVMRTIARTDWEHSIAPTKQLRYSITLRTLRTQTFESAG
jgi:alkylated DNA repair dioxygenase AlkB